jgi:Flp pilus assembly protein TadG
LEFALVLPALLFILLGSMDYARLMWLESTVRYAVQEGARCASLGTSPAYCCADSAIYACGGSNTPSDYAASKAVAAGLTAANFKLTSTACGSQMQSKNVTFSFISPAYSGRGATAGNMAIAAQACYP